MMSTFSLPHGLSDNGDKTYLIPYDGVPDFLERTANSSRDEVFDCIGESEICDGLPRHLLFRRHP